MPEANAGDPGTTTGSAPALPLPTDTAPARPSVDPLPMESDSRPARYRPLRLHAQGGLGEVLLAHDGELQREVALKRIQEAHARDGESRRRFLLEAEVTSRLEHPGVVPVYGLVQGDDGRPCYAMRFIQGESLKDAIDHFHADDRPGRDPRERRLALQRLLGRFVAVCNTVAYAHSRGILHRDLKPANVMLGKYGETLVVDWGLAKKFSRGEADRSAGEESLTPTTLRPADGGTQLGLAAGTPAYMSPEQAAGRWDTVGPASDVYSLGATLYHLLTGQAPVQGSDARILLERVQHGDWPPPRQVKRDVPRALEAVCLQAMAPRPAERYASALELAADVERWLAGEPVSAWREPLTVRLRRWVGRHRTLVTAAASAVLVALVSMAIGMGLLIAANQRAEEARQNAEMARQDAEANERIAEKARQDAETNEQVAARKRDEAAASLKLAGEVIDRFSTRVNADPRLQEKDLEELRKQLLQSAVKAYQTLLEVGSDEPDVQAQLSRAYVQLAYLTLQMGDRAQAARYYKQAIDQMERLIAAHPDKLDYQRHQGMNYTDLGIAHSQNQEGAEAEKYFREALKIQEPLASRKDARSEDHNRLANTRLNLGVLYFNQGKYAEAEPLLLQAQQEWEKLAKAEPKDLDYKADLGNCALNLGAVYAKWKKAEKAIEALEKALQINKEVVGIEPTYPKHRARLAITHFNLAGTYKQTDKRLTHYHEALKLQDELARRSPGVGVYQEQLANTCDQLGRLQQKVGDLRGAETTYLHMLEAATRLTEMYPGADKHQKLLDDAHRGLGWTYRLDSRLNESEAAYLKALKISKDLAAKHPNDAHYQYRLGFCHNLLGIVYKHMNRLEDAEKQHRAALKIRESLFKRDGNDPQYRANLASTCTNLANLCPGPVKEDEAEALFLKSIELQKDLVRQRENVDQDTLDYAMSYNNLGLLYYDQNKLKEAETAFLKALEIRADLVARRPGVHTYLNDLRMSHNNLGALYKDLKDFPKAERSYRDAIKVGEELVQAQPAVQDFAARLADTHFNLAQLLVARGDDETALDEYSRAIKRLEPWAKRGPNALTPAARETLVNAHNNRAATLLNLGRFKEALPHLDRAIGLMSQGTGGIRVNRAMTRALAGDYLAAVDEAVELAGAPGIPPFALFQLARIHALSSSAAAKDEKLPEPRRKDLADLYARRAVSLLGEVHKAGLFKDAKERDVLKKDEAYAPLREREDFQQLLKKIEPR